MRLIIIILFLLVSSGAKADIFIFQTDSTLHRNISFSFLKVIDQRYDTSRIGLLLTDELNTGKNDIKTLYSIPVEFAGFFRNISKEAVKGADTLVLVLYDFFIQDRPNGYQVGVFHIDGDFFIGKSGRYRYLGGVDSLYETAGGLDISGKIRRLASNRFASILQVMGTRTAGTAIFSLSDVARFRKAECMQYAVYRMNNYKPGIYYTVDDFLKQTPIDTPLVDIHKGEPGMQTKTFFYYADRKRDADKKIKDCLVVVTDYGEYEYGAKGSIRLEKYNGQFIFRRTFKGILKKDLTTASIMYGVVGYLAITSLTSLSSQKGDVIYKSRLDTESQTFRPMRRIN